VSDQQNEDHLRQLLHALADDVSVPGSAPPPLLRRFARRRAQTVAMGGLALGVVALAAVAAPHFQSRAPASRQLAAPVPHLVNTVSLPNHPTRISVGGGSVWVLDSDHGSRSQIDPETGTVDEVTRHSSVDVTVSNDLLVSYSKQSDSSFAVTIADETNQVAQTIRLPGASRRAGRVAIGLDALWVARWSPEQRHRPGEVLEIDTATKRVVATIPLSSGQGGLAVGEDAVWVTDADRGLLQRVDPESRNVTTAELGGDLADVAVGYGSVWISDAARQKVYRLDPATLKTIAAIAVPGGAGWLAVGEGGVWSAGAQSGNVSLIDPETNSVHVPLIELHGQLRGIAIGEGGVWVTNTTARSVVQIRLDRVGQDPALRGAVAIRLIVKNP
jgi:DNA-binding beta-propeller fold protein YncE